MYYLPGDLHDYTYLWQYLIALNFPALLLTHFASSAVVFLTNIGPQVVYSIVGIAFVSLQWIILGAICHLLINTVRKPRTQ